MKHNILLILLLILLGNILLYSAESKNVTKMKIKCLLESVEDFQNVDIDSASYYSYKALKLAEKNHFPREQAEVKYQLGIISCMRSELDLAEKYFGEALDSYKILSHEESIAKLHNAFGQLYRNTGQYDLSLEQLFKAYAIKEVLGNESSMAITLNNLGITYWELSDYPKALEYSQRAHNIALRANDTNEIIHSGNTVANVYYMLDSNNTSIRMYESLLTFVSDKDIYKKANIINNIANIQSEMGLYQEALKNYGYSYDIEDKMNLKNAKAKTLLNIGLVNLKLNNNDKATQYYFQAKNIFESVDNELGSADAITGLALVSGNTGNHTEAINGLKQALATYLKYGINAQIVTTYKELFKANQVAGHFQEAISYQNKYINLKEEIIEANNQSFTQAIEMKLHAEARMKNLKNELEIKRVELQNFKLIIFWIASIIISLVLGIIIFRKIKRDLVKQRSIAKNGIKLKEYLNNKMDEEIRTSLFYLASDIAMLENRNEYEKLSTSYSKFAQEYNQLIDRLKIDLY